MYPTWDTTWFTTGTQSCHAMSGRNVVMSRTHSPLPRLSPSHGMCLLSQFLPLEEPVETGVVPSLWLLIYG